MTLRIGVLGASRIAELAIVGPTQELGHRLVAVAARDPRRAEAFAALSVPTTRLRSPAR